VVGMAGRYTGSYLDQCSGWRAVATLADIGQASLVGRIGAPAMSQTPKKSEVRIGLTHRARRRPTSYLMGFMFTWRPLKRRRALACLLFLQKACRERGARPQPPFVPN
jgi:hypothetical protein